MDRTIGGGEGKWVHEAIIGTGKMEMGDGWRDVFYRNGFLFKAWKHHTKVLLVFEGDAVIA